MAARFSSSIRYKAAVLALTLFAAPGLRAKQDRTTELQSKYEHASDAVHRARALEPLGHAQFKNAEQLLAAGKLNDALGVLRQYRDEARETLRSLDAAGINAEKHTNGFKQLEFSIRESLRRLDALLVNLSGEDQRPFRQIRGDLADMEAHLLHELFPSQPSTNGTPGKR